MKLLFKFMGINSLIRYDQIWRKSFKLLNEFNENKVNKIERCPIFAIKSMKNPFSR